MNDPIRHEIELGEDVQLMLYCDIKSKSDLVKNIDTLTLLLRKLFGDKNYLLIEAPGKFFTNSLLRHKFNGDGTYDLLYSFKIEQDNTDISWNVFFSRIDNLIIYEFSSKLELENASCDFYRTRRHREYIERKRNEQ